MAPYRSGDFKPLDSGAVFWPAVFLGAFLANYLLTPVGSFISIAIAAGNTLEALVAVLLIHRFLGTRDPFARFADLTKFLLFACAIGPAVSATIGNLALCLGHSGRWADLPALWLTWWIGDGSGALVLCPWILSLKELPKKEWQLGKAAEYLSLIVVAILTCILTSGYSLPLAFIHIPILVWASTRFSQLGAFSIIILISAITIKTTIDGHGQFALQDHNASLLMVQLFIITGALTGQIVLALVTERKNYIRRLIEEESKLLRSEKRFGQLAEKIPRSFTYGTHPTPNSLI